MFLYKQSDYYCDACDKTIKVKSTSKHLKILQTTNLKNVDKENTPIKIQNFLI